MRDPIDAEPADVTLTRLRPKVLVSVVHEFKLLQILEIEVDEHAKWRLLEPVKHGAKASVNRVDKIVVAH